MSERSSRWNLIVGQTVGNPYFIFVLRLLLGAIFIVAAVGKLPQGAEFVDEVTGRGLLPNSWARAYGSILPWLELAVGIALVVGFRSRYASGVSLLMIIGFLVANGTALYRSEPNPDCACFGDILVMGTGDALVIDIVIMAMSLLILFHRRQFLSVDGLLRGKRRGSSGEPASSKLS